MTVATRSFRALALWVATAATAGIAQPSPEQAGGAAQAASTASVIDVVRSVEAHPALVALQASADAAALDLQALRSPVSVGGSAVWNRGDVSVPEIPGPGGGPARSETEWTQQVQVDVAFRPFLAGDLADAGAQRELVWMQAERRLRETKATLEAAALEAAAAVHVAIAGVDLARAGEELAASALDATRLRFTLGAATDTEVRRAEVALERAQEGVRVAAFRRDDAVATLRDLTGSTVALDSIPDLAPATGSDPAIQRALDDLALAAIGVQSAQRALLPTAQASYAWNRGDDSVSVSLETRTWQPTVSYAQPSALGGVDLGIDPSVPAEFRPTLDGALTLAVSMEFSPALVTAVEAAKARQVAAEAALTAARRDAEAAAVRRAEAIRAATTQVAFAALDLDLAVRDRDDARRRFDLGLVSPLGLLDAERAVLDGRLALDAARLELLSATLRGYRDLGIPLTEVLP